MSKGTILLPCKAKSITLRNSKKRRRIRLVYYTCSERHFQVSNIKNTIFVCYNRSVWTLQNQKIKDVSVYKDFGIVSVPQVLAPIKSRGRRLANLSIHFFFLLNFPDAAGVCFCFQRLTIIGPKKFIGLKLWVHIRWAFYPMGSLK